MDELETSATKIYGYLMVGSDADIGLVPVEDTDYELLPGSIAYVVGGGAYILTPALNWVFLNPDIQKLVGPVFATPEEQPEPYTLPAATAEALGGVYQAINVSPIDTTGEVDASTCATAINDILEVLISAGIMEQGQVVEETP